MDYSKAPGMNPPITREFAKLPHLFFRHCYAYAGIIKTHE
jgi:hypothetical protein